MTIRFPSLVFGLSALALSCLPAHAEVLLVDANGYGDFTSAQEAIDAAAEGDTIYLQRPGIYIEDPRYPHLEIRGKSLTLAGAPTVRTQVYSIVVSGLARDQSVTISDLVIDEHLEILDNEGPVLITDCLLSPFVHSYFYESVGCRVFNSASVTFNRYRSVWIPIHQGHPPRAGLDVIDSNVVLNDCRIEGAEGFFVLCTSTSYVGEPGTPGILLEGSTLRASGCSVEGGSGGDDWSYCYIPGSGGGVGGPALWVSPDSEAIVVDTELLGGRGGFSVFEPGVPGVPFVGAPLLLDSYVPTLEAPVRGIEHRSVPVVLRGRPGDEARLITGSRAQSRPLGDLAGVLLAGGQLQVTAAGTIPASGELTVDVELPPAPAGAAVSRVLQGAFTAPDGSLRLSNPTLLTSLDGDALPWLGRRAHVRPSVAVPGDGTSWQTARQDLRALLHEIPDLPDLPVEVFVAEGTYKPAPPGGDVLQAFQVWPGTQIYGGFQGDETRLDQRDPVAHRTVLSGDLDGNGNGEGGLSELDDNSVTIVILGAHRFQSGSVDEERIPLGDTRVDGCWIVGGNSSEGTSHQRSCGVLIRGRGFVNGCTLTSNHTGIRSDSAFALAANCRIVGNGRGTIGGGIALSGTHPLTGVASVTNCLIASNRSYGVVASVYPSAPISSSTIVNNGLDQTGTSGLAGRCRPVRNSIVWANGSQGGGPHTLEEQLDLDDIDVVEYSCIQGLGATDLGPGNIDSDPGFVDPLGTTGVFGGLGSDLSLGALSPCIDAGSNAAVPGDAFDLDRDGDRTELLPIDLEGGRRFRDDPNVPDTGAGPGRVVDMGALERHAQPTPGG